MPDLLSEESREVQRRAILVNRDICQDIPNSLNRLRRCDAVMNPLFCYWINHVCLFAKGFRVQQRPAAAEFACPAALVRDVAAEVACLARYEHVQNAILLFRSATTVT